MRLCCIHQKEKATASRRRKIRQFNFQLRPRNSRQLIECHALSDNFNFLPIDISPRRVRRSSISRFCFLSSRHRKRLFSVKSRFPPITKKLRRFVDFPNAFQFHRLIVSSQTGRVRRETIRLVILATPVGDGIGIIYKVGQGIYSYLTYFSTTRRQGSGA